ncbi:feruloyl-CoA synthase [Emcibacter sp.]|uniref:feruloyl-CoA synthase n=1 Tax=Emcibacter sp. TaxID=1979954 RepID=UPI003A925330
MEQNKTVEQTWQQAPMREISLWKPDINVRRTEDGTIYITQKKPLPEFPGRIMEPLVHFAETAPDRVFLADRGKDGEWRKLTYREALAKARNLGQFLLDQGLSADRPLLILSGNDLEHALLGLACAYVGVPYAPVSAAYSNPATEYKRLMEIVPPLNPGMIYAAEKEPFSGAIAAIANPDTKLLFGDSKNDQGIDFASAVATPATQAVDEAFDRVTGDTIVKFLFTSGSTGTPKAVINTNSMISAGQIMTSETFLFMKEEPVVVLDWAPWNHTAGGNKVFYMVMFNGGSLYIDDGRPTPGEIHKTIRNLEEVSPSWYFNLPKGFEMLLDHMKTHPEFCQKFFKNLKMLWYAGAKLSQHTWNTLEERAVATTGTRILIGTGLGATETSPVALFCTWPQEESGNMGLPCNGCELKLVPTEGKYDARVRGPNIMPGYYKNPEATKKAFDEEGFYCFGDALKPLDPDDFSIGFLFDGRTAENFKLNTGTWVNTGALRDKIIDHYENAVKDVAIAGADRDFLSALIFPNFDVVAKKLNLSSTTPEEIVATPEVREYFKTKLDELAAQSTGSSTLIRRALLIEIPPSAKDNEVTDKGSVNQRALIQNRAHLVEEIYDGSPRIIEISKRKK